MTVFFDVESQLVESLRRNPNVKNATERPIQFSEEFKRRAFEDVLAEIGSCIECCNEQRPQCGLGRMTPTEYRRYLLKHPPIFPAVLYMEKTDAVSSSV